VSDFENGVAADQLALATVGREGLLRLQRRRAWVLMHMMSVAEQLRLASAEAFASACDELGETVYADGPPRTQ
jgi:hypothetical protein